MRKYWRHYCCLHFYFTKRQLRQIERKHRILILPALTEDVVEKIFLRHFKELGFDKLGREEGCFEKIWERIGERIDFKGVDCIGWKGDQPHTIEFETWASFARFHDYMGYLDYIVCFQKDDWQGNYGSTQIIELWQVLKLKEIILQDELESFLYINDPNFERYYNEVLRTQYMEKMRVGIARSQNKGC